MKTKLERMAEDWCFSGMLDAKWWDKHGDGREILHPERFHQHVCRATFDAILAHFERQRKKAKRRLRVQETPEVKS